MEVFLPFDAPLAVGQTFSLDFDNGGVDGGKSVGVALQNENRDTLWQFYFPGGEDFYRAGEPSQETDLNWMNSGLNLAFTLLADNAYQVTLQPFEGTTRTLSGTLPMPSSTGGTGVRAADAAQQITQMRAWNYSAGKGGEANLYINNPKITETVETDPQFCIQGITFVSSAEPLEISSFGVPAGGNGLTFSLASSLEGVTYAVYECLDLLEEPTQTWSRVTGTAVAGTGGAISLSVPNLDRPQNHYRIGYTITP